MMDAAEEIPLREDPEKKPCAGVVQEMQRPYTASITDPVSKVLEDDNLLREILLCVSFPTTLVRAALVCKRWYQHASDLKFLRCFRELHPPRLLGFYFNGLRAPRFVPMLPQSPELTAVIRCGCFSCRNTYQSDSAWSNVVDCRNGRVLVGCHDVQSELILGVHCTLCAETSMTILPTLPPSQAGYYCNFQYIFSKEDGNGLSYLYLSVQSNLERTESMVRVYVWQDGVWCMHTSASHQHFYPDKYIQPVLVHNKIYIASLTDIVVFDLELSSLSTIQPPDGVEYGTRDTLLSQTDDASGVYLIHMKKLQLYIWLHKRDNWLLLDTICLRMLDHTLEDEYPFDVQITGVGVDAEFVFLATSRFVLYLDIKCRTLRKVHERTNDDTLLENIYPLMMIWPPIFPKLKDAAARNVT